jgi:hypothetical protein
MNALFERFMEDPAWTEQRQTAERLYERVFTGMA